MVPDDGSSDFEPFDQVEIERRLMVTLPAGWQMAQFRAEQPSTGYKEFKSEILNEIARCLNMPFNVAAGNSALLQLLLRAARSPDLLQEYPGRPVAMRS